MKKYCIINTENKKITKIFEKYGYICIPTEKSDKVSGPISCHADVLYLKTGENEIYVSDCQKNNIHKLKNIGIDVKTVSLSPGYNTESMLNMVITEKSVIYNPKTATDIKIFSGDRQIIKTNQGYTKCSTVVLPQENYITEDKGIYRLLSDNGKNCLLVEKGSVKLDGYQYGFIGGSSAFLEKENVLFFFGDISVHRDYKKISAFCEKAGIDIMQIEGEPLTDIGGAVII